MRYFTLWLAFTGSLLLSVGPAGAQTSGASQAAHAAIRWGTYVEVSGPAGARRKVPTFTAAYHGPNEQVGTFALRLEGYVPAGEVRNAVYQPFSAADVRLLDLSKLPAAPTPLLSHGTARKLPVSYLSLQPVRRNPQSGQPEQLVSFDYVYSLDNSSPTPSASARQKGALPGWAEAHAYAPASVLATGEWYKIGVPESGLYKLDRATLSKLGIDPQKVDPRRLQLYGNATGLLPQPNAAPRPDDLVQNDVQLVGDNGNAAFDDNEYLLFYARGPHVWQAKNGLFQHVNNIYADTAYYFLTVGAAAGRRVAAAPAVTAAAPTVITTFNERLVYEHDLVNLLKSGRQWLGESLADGEKKEVVFAGLPGLVAGAPLTITSSVAATATVAPTFQLTLNGQAFGRPQSVPGIGTYEFHEIAQTSVAQQQGTVPAGSPTELRVALSYSTPSDPRATGYLDYLEINTLRQLALSAPTLEFRSLINNGTARVNRYVLGGASGATVWDVTNPRRPAAVTLDGSGAFLARTDTLREFVAFRPDGAALPTPRPFGRVGNQNLHALNGDGKLDLVIVAYPLFRAEAERLATHRRSHNNLRVAVVTTQEVYNEYSSGAQDVTAIRDFMRQVYNRAPAGKNLNLLLFGDASFDYKSKASNDGNFEPEWWKKERKPFGETITADAFNQNYVPTYESRESFSRFYGRSGGEGSASYSSEDYYGLLDENEGEWNELSLASELMDVGVGRLPVRVPKDVAASSPTATLIAHRMVDKLIAYDAPTAYGKWRNRLTLVSDDGNGDLFVGQGSEIIASELLTTDPAYNIHKVYLDLYPQVSEAAGQRSPGTERAIDESFERGSLIINYLGHGGPQGWTDEQILTNASVKALQNRNALAFLITGTCDFAAYDDPSFTSAGEEVLTDNEQLGGAIGLFTTTRVVDASANAGLNQSFFKRLFERLPDGGRPGMGTIIMNAKNDYPQGGTNNRNYTLLGDPSAALAYPDEQVAVRALSLNGQPTAPTETLRALSKVKLEGEVRTGTGPATSFNGTAQVTVFDKPAVVMTLGNEAADADSGDRPRPVSVQESVIYDGQATVRNGRFSVEFVVPKDINYNVGLGKISLYAFDPTSGIDAHGAQQQSVGGSDPNALTDTTPPRIRLGLNDTTFASGGLTNLTPTLVAFLSDESGINTAGAGIGHEITATLDRDPTKLVVLNDAYTATVDNFRAGQVRYLLKDLAPGPHVLKLKAWDTYNNAAEREVEFIAASTEKLALDHVLNYPNPFSSVTQFHFDHNRSGEDLDVQVQIFTVTGRLVRTLRTTVPASRPHEGGLTWDGRDDYNDQLARGVYVYRLRVRVGQDGPTASKYEKLVLLN